MKEVRFVCYSCSICGESSKPREPRRVHTIYKNVYPKFGNGPPTKQVAQELPVCDACDQLLKGGVSLQQVFKERGKLAPPGYVETTIKERGVSIRRPTSSGVSR